MSALPFDARDRIERELRGSFPFEPAPRVLGIASRIMTSLTAGAATELPDAEALARRFHETYERLAPQHDYRTRQASAKPWAEVPENNRALMTAVAAEVLSWLAGGSGLSGHGVESGEQ
jgi:hypothetical protein